MTQQLNAVILPSRIVDLEWFEGADNAFGNESHEIQKRIYREFQIERSLFFCGLVSESVGLSPSLAFWTKFAREFVRDLLLAPDIEQKRGRIELELPETLCATLLESAPAMTGIELLDKSQLQKTWRGFHKGFQTAIDGHEGSVESLLRKLTPNHELSNRIHFHLVENHKNAEAPFAFIATYSTDAGRAGAERHLPLNYALKEFKGRKSRLLELLSTVHRAARHSDLARELLDSGELFQPISMTAREAYRFLKEVPVFEESGILCRIPRWWAGKPRRISLSITIGAAAPGRLGLDALLNFEAGLQAGGEPLTEREAREIARQYSGLAFIKGKWMAVDPQALQATLAQFEKARQLAGQEKISLSEAMQLMMGQGAPPALKGIEPENIGYGPWLGDIFKKMGEPSLARSVKISSSIKANLRAYQMQGVNWLHLLHDTGFGMCLADDMGLGKTLQALALLQTLKEKEKDFSVCLAIVPASLMSNWLAEIEKFTPGLRAVAAHPQMMEARALKSLPGRLKEWDLVITTYAMARRLDWLKKREWYYTILDEAQAIKNAGTAQTRAVKEIGGRHRLVMTGTPVENRLGELWSLFDFINPGLLGGARRFDVFTRSLENDPAGYGRLRKVIRPYILRRLKTDKSVISDLPDKVEMKCYAELSRHQAALYQELVKQLATDLAGMEGIQKRGVVLSYLIRFKQLCNHPDHLTGQKGYKEEYGGKFIRLRELCETVREKRERMLIFTQFREIIGPLDNFLSSVFGRPGLTLHGGTTVKARSEAVARFQGVEYTPYFVLSLKAGGTGLNLTAASHVIHFDRWWNPAVENQATDRAFRIGQKKNVVVHKLICKGTIEEKIDVMMEDKKALSEKVLCGGGESWITEFSNEKIIEMFKHSL